MTQPPVSLQPERGLARFAGEGGKALLLLALLAFAARGWTFGNPVIHVDDQFYLLAGERLLDGVWPYADLWDRKPVGLFLLYAAIVWLFPDPVLGYQIAAALCVAATAWLVFRMARGFASFGAALAGGAAYVAWLPLFGGIGGQAPVFYNLVVAASAAAVLALVRRGGARALLLPGCAIMLAMGLAMQVKYTAMFEGIWFGLTLLWLGLRAGRGWGALAASGALWIACALLPTAAAWAAYATKGQAEVFVHANFLSVFADRFDRGEAYVRLFWQVLGLSPFWACIAVAWRYWRGAADPERGQALWLLGWAGAALAGYLVFGNWFDHYVLPLLVPLALGAALAFDAIARRRLAIGLVVGLGMAAGLSRAAVDRIDRGSRAEVLQLAALAQQHRGDRCLYVTEDIPILYYLTGSCIPTRFGFPEHLALDRFTAALGADQAGEIARVLERRPGAIVYLNDPDSRYAPAARGVLEAALRRDYRLAGEARTGAKLFRVYALKRP